MLSGKHGNHVSADLVGCITVGRDAIRAHDHAVYFALLHHMAGHVVSDNRHRDVVFVQFPCGQPRALQKRTRLVCNHRDSFTSVDRAANYTERRAVIARRCQRSGVAMRQHGRAIGNQVCAKASQRAIRVNIFLKDRQRFVD